MLHFLNNKLSMVQFTTRTECHSKIVMGWSYLKPRLRASKSALTRLTRDVVEASRIPLMTCQTGRGRDTVRDNLDRKGHKPSGHEGRWHGSHRTGSELPPLSLVHSHIPTIYHGSQEYVFPSFGTLWVPHPGTCLLHTMALRSLLSRSSPLGLEYVMLMSRKPL